MLTLRVLFVGYLGGEYLVSRLFCYLFYVFKESMNNIEIIRELLSNLDFEVRISSLKFQCMYNLLHNWCLYKTNSVCI
jgi:hypothetical protein